MININEIIQDVQNWAVQKGIVSEENSIAQMDKMDEEVTELYHEVHYGTPAGVKDELGDVLVTCIVQAACWNLSIQECLEAALNKISKRTGKVIDGVFVKDTK